MIQHNTEDDGCQRSASRPSSLQAAVRLSSAFSAATKDDYISPNYHHAFAPIAPFRSPVQNHHQFTPISLSEYGSPPPATVKPVRTSFSICIDSKDESPHNHDEEDLGWNPPVPQAISYSQNDEDNVCSPLTVPTHTSPPGFHESRRTNAFVPIREWATPLSTNLSSWDPKRGIDEKLWSEYKIHHRGEDEEEELMSPSYKRQGTPYHASSRSPYSMESPAAKYIYNKPSPYAAEAQASHGYRKPLPSYCGGRTMAPSPAFTAETADLTLDSLTSSTSYADAQYTLRNERFLQAIGSPPLYRPRSSLAQASSRSSIEAVRTHSAPTVGRPVIAKPKEPDDVQQRKCRLKTELCMHYENGRPCPFGASK
jgi:hypothetical protein